MSDGSVVLTLVDRAKTHGHYEEQAKTAQAIKETMRMAPNWLGLDADQRESLDLIATKLSRILHGDPDVADHWHDLGGYPLLIEQRLKGG